MPKVDTRAEYIDKIFLFYDTVNQLETGHSAGSTPVPEPVAEPDRHVEEPEVLVTRVAVGKHLQHVLLPHVDVLAAHFYAGDVVEVRSVHGGPPQRADQPALQLVAWPEVGEDLGQDLGGKDADDIGVVHF